jgi:hypothetical protein
MIKRTVIVRPLGHFLHGFHFRTTSFGDIHPVVQLFQPLYVPRVHPPFGGMPQDYRSGAMDLKSSDPGVERKLMEALGGDTLDSLLRIDTLDKFQVWADHIGHSRDYRMLTNALAGRRGRAALLAEREIANYDKRMRVGDPSEVAWSRTRIRRLRRLIRIFESGQTRTNRLLRTFERINVCNNGVEQWWRWSPVVE